MNGVLTRLRRGRGALLPSPRRPADPPVDPAGGWDVLGAAGQAPGRTPGARGRVLGDRRRALILLVAVVVVLGGGGIGYLQLTGGSADDAGAAAVAVRPASTGSARTASPGSSASGTPSASGGTSPTAASPSRNPFGGLAVTGAPGTSGATGPAASTTAPTTAPSGTAATVAPPVTTATVTAVRTTTVTATATPVYVGLYGWTDAGLPELRVNDTAATPSPGATFGGTLVYTGTSVSGGLTCADVTSAGTARQICPGSVVKVR